MALHLDAGMLKETYTRFNADKAPRLAAALSYSTIFAIAPVLIIVIAIAGNVIAVTYGHGHGHGAVRDQLLLAIQRSAGKEAADTVREMVQVAFAKHNQSGITQIIGWITLIAGAAGLFAALQDALNTVWHADPPKRTLWGQVRDRIASIGMLLAIGFLLLVTTAINAGITFVSTSVTHLLPFAGAGVLFAAVNIVVEIALVTLLFALMFKYLPDTHVAWHDVWTGSVATSVLFVIGQSLIGLYLSKAGIASGYGAAGSILVLLVWIYYSSMILLFGAELTRVFAESHGSRAGAPSAATAAGGAADAHAATPSPAA
jgi:membrane protein